ncbi:MAG: glycerophosphoryl diester phosphodiesterase membrane domain-containing protein [Cryobacterium sp.]
MSDPWQPPTSGEPTPARRDDFAPPESAPTPGPAPGSRPAAPVGGYGPAPTNTAPPLWAPPPKPGLIPLRPLGFGALLGAPFRVLRRNPRATFGSALIVQSIITLVTLVVVGAVTLWAFGRIESAPLEEQAEVEAGATVSIVLSALIPAALQLVGGALLQGVIVVEVSRATLGEKLPLAALWRSVGRRLWVLVLWTVILGGALLLAVTVVAGFATVLAVLGGGAGVAAAVLVGVVGGLGLIVLAAWLYTRTSLVPCLIVLERLSIRAAIGRSWSLTQGYFWRTLGIQLLVAVIVNAVAQVVTTPLLLLFTYAVSLVDPNASVDAYLPAIILYVLTLFLALVIGAVTAVIQSATIAFIYLDLRMRTEGLDLELQRYVESVHSGAVLPDPYRAAATPAPPAA